MEQVFIKTDYSEYVAHIEQDKSRLINQINGRVYPITYYKVGATDEEGWGYDSRSIGGETHKQLNDDCRVMFDFSFCWRGDWESRVYFKDDDYWGGELESIADIWGQLIPILKEKINQI